MDVRALPAGRDLDCAVSERVMGKPVVARDWPCGRDPECGAYEATTFRPTIAEAMGQTWSDWFGTPDAVIAVREDGWPPHLVEGHPGQMAAEVEPVPFYSRDIAAAWTVVEALSARGWYVSVEWRHSEWNAEVDRYEANLLGTGETAPVAICRAALLAEECG